MASTDPTPVRHTAEHLIVETTSTESVAGSVIPSISVKGVTIGSLGHLQVMRYVYTLVEAQQVFFKGRPLSAMPGIREALVEWLTPGQQIVSRPTGRYSVMHAYTGKKNIFQPQIMQKEIGSLPLGYLDLIGKDPAAGVRLYGRADVPFVTRGKANPIAAAYYNSDKKRLQIIQNPDPKTLMARFAARAPRGAVAVG
jgi:hypothetical protein